MKITVLSLLLCTAAQALPAEIEPQIFPPSGGSVSTISVARDADLQKAIDRARPGDVIELRAGVTYVGNFLLPQKSGTKYITIRTAPSSSLPQSGGRIEPSHAPKLAKIQSPSGSPALRTAPGSHHWRLLWLEFGPNAGGVGDIITLGDASAAQSGENTPHDFIIDRCYIHGDPQLGQKRGVAMNSATTTIIGSYISDIKAVGQDAQAIEGWNGPGPFHIENNYLEASGENFMLGGAIPGTSGLVPSDVVFRRNHVARPPSWRDERWTVKNLFELKNARRVLVEGNLFENNWVSAQPGYAIVLTPRGERGAASWATIEDVTFRDNVIRNVAAVFNLLGKDDSGPSGIMRRVKIEDNLIYGFNRDLWGGNGVFLQIGDGPSDITVEHNTVVQTGNIITVYGGSRDNPTAVNRFVFRNNITLHNANGVIGQGLAMGTNSISAYFPDGLFARNVLAGGRQDRYPSDNLFPDVARFAQQFVNYAERDYRLRPESEFRRAASDGADLGVNFVALVRTIGVRAREWLGSAIAGSAASSTSR